MIRYRIPTQVQVSTLHNRPLLSTRQGGHVAVDTAILALWQFADGRSLSEIVAARRQFHPAATPRTINIALACLCEAALLERITQPAPETKPSPVQEPFVPPDDKVSISAGYSVSAIIVNYNSLDWLKGCIPSLLAQTCPPTQIIVVDNGSHDQALDWLAANYPAVLRHQIEQPTSLAHAINLGCSLAEPGSHLLILNPDILLEPDAIQQMLATAQSNPSCAAVAAKLYFSWAPPFLNGLGNQVGPVSWGTDNALGHLDIGQFDDLEELPSACFAAALVPWAAWQTVGPLDEGFPMYYEDVEWCYRARLMGFKVLAAPRAVIYHAFGGTGGPIGQSEGLSPRKLSNVVYGRLRFAIKLLKQRRGRFLRNYLAEDVFSIFRSLGARDWAMARARLTGWQNILHSLPGIKAQRCLLQARRAINDEKLFAIQQHIPAPITWSGLPELTWDLVTNTYAPLIYTERSRPMPEFSPYSRRLHMVVVCPPPGPAPEAPSREQAYLALAQALSEHMDVTFATPVSTASARPVDDSATVEAQDPAAPLHQVSYWIDRPDSLYLLLENSDVILISGYMVDKIPNLEYTPTRLVIDLHDTLILDDLQEYQSQPLAAQQAINERSHAVFKRLLEVGDFFLCKDESQRSFWLGALAISGRINPLNFQQDPSLRKLIDLMGDSPQAPYTHLVRYCLEGRPAPDRLAHIEAVAADAGEPTGLFATAFYLLRRGGAKALFQRVRRHLIWRLSRV